jgi:hypothetical protein
MKNYGKVTLVLLLGAILFAGCAEEETTAPQEVTDIPGLISQGWSQYEAGKFSSSNDSFNNALTLAQDQYWEAYGDSLVAAQQGDSAALEDATVRLEENRDYLVEIYTGFGWLTIEYNVPDQGALLFTLALEFDPIHEDALAGYAVFLQIMEEYHQSNEKADALLALNPTWQFEHNAQIDYLDLMLIQAQNDYYLADFEASLARALALNDLLGYQPGLTEDNFNLATIEGRAALIELIDALDDLI